MKFIFFRFKCKFLFLDLEQKEFLLFFPQDPFVFCRPGSFLTPMQHFLVAAMLYASLSLFRPPFSLLQVMMRGDRCQQTVQLFQKIKDLVAAWQNSQNVRFCLQNLFRLSALVWWPCMSIYYFYLPYHTRTFFLMFLKSEKLKNYWRSSENKQEGNPLTLRDEKKRDSENFVNHTENV